MSQPRAFQRHSVGLRERRTERVRAWPRQHDAWLSGHQMSWSSALCTMYVLSPVGAMRALLPQVSDILLDDLPHHEAPSQRL